jgi:hypothetical protein
MLQECEIDRVILLSKGKETGINLFFLPMLYKERDNKNFKNS